MGIAARRAVCHREEPKGHPGFLLGSRGEARTPAVGGGRQRSKLPGSLLGDGLRARPPAARLAGRWPLRSVGDHHQVDQRRVEKQERGQSVEVGVRSRGPCCSGEGERCQGGSGGSVAALLLCHSARDVVASVFLLRARALEQGVIASWGKAGRERSLWATRSCGQGRLETAEATRGRRPPGRGGQGD